jgi:hypothetical protein
MSQAIHEVDSRRSLRRTEAEERIEGTGTFDEWRDPITGADGHFGILLQAPLPARQMVQLHTIRGRPAVGEHAIPWRERRQVPGYGFAASFSETVSDTARSARGVNGYVTITSSNERVVSGRFSFSIIVEFESFRKPDGTAGGRWLDGDGRTRTITGEFRVPRWPDLPAIPGSR